MEFLAENAVWGGLGFSEGKELHSPGTTMDQLNSSRAKFPLMWGVRDSRKRQEGRRGLGGFFTPPQPPWMENHTWNRLGSNIRSVQGMGRALLCH